MQKRRIAFERVPLNEVRRLLEEQNNADEKPPTVTDGDNQSKRVARDQSLSAKNVQKHRAHPKRSIRTEGADHPLGLWIDMEILRKHRNQPPHIVLHDPMLKPSNRYLEPADCALTHKKSKPKTSVDGDGMEGTGT